MRLFPKMPLGGLLLLGAVSACDGGADFELSSVAPPRVSEAATLELAGRGFCGSIAIDGECSPDAVVSLGTTTISPDQTLLYSDERIRLEVPALPLGALSVVVSVEGVASNTIVIEVQP